MASIAHVALPPWKARIKQSLVQNSSLVYAKYVQLATVRPDGTPACRTVVFRGFLDDGHDLTFVTDRRSRKVTEVAASPAAEACWYFPNSREQYRIAGTLTIVDDQHPSQQLQKARQRAWSNMSDGGRAQFTWPDPGQPKEDAAAFSQRAPAGQDPALPTFCLVVMKVKEVDLVNLFENKRTLFRQVAQQEGATAWSEEDVNP